MKLLNLILSVILTITCMPAFPQTNPVSGANMVQNYILNGGFENARHGWAAYKNTSQALPVTGTGGTPTTTITTTTGTPLAGKASGVISHPASNVQGEGVSYDFTAEAGSLGRTLQISGVYQISSGTYSGGSPGVDSDVEVYIYDKDAGSVIQPAGYKLDGGVTGTNYLISATFAPNSITSTHYRLIFHNATTTTSAFALKIDSVVVSLQVRTNAVPVTDWVPFTSTVGAATTAPTAGSYSYNQKQWRRIGDSMEIYYQIATTSAGTAGSGTYKFPIPTGYSIDASKHSLGSTQQAVGIARIAGGGANNYNSIGQVYIYDSTNLALQVIVPAGGITAVGSGTSDFSGAANYDFVAKVPIVGWSSNAVMGDSADSRVVQFSAGANANSGYGIGPTTVTWSTIKDTHGAFNGSTTYTIPVAGTYLINMTGVPQTASSGGGSVGTATWALLKNGTSLVTQFSQYGTTFCSTSNFCSPVPLLYSGSFNAGDAITITFGQNAGGTGPLTLSPSSWSIIRIAGSTQVLAADSVNARYTSVTGTIGTSLTQLSFATKDYDSHSAWSGSVYTAPSPGLYSIKFRVTTSGVSLPVGGFAQSAIYKNGSSVAGMQVNGTGASGTAYTMEVPESLKLLAGDQISFYASSSVATNVNAAATYTSFAIERVGN